MTAISQRTVARFVIGFLPVMLLFVLANLLSYYARTFMPGAADALNRIGFPFMFWEEGGFSYTHRFSHLAFWSDIAIAAFFSILGGVLFVRSVR